MYHAEIFPLSRAAAGLEEGEWTADRLVRLQISVTERGGVNAMTPDELHSIGQQLRKGSTSSDANLGIRTQSVRSEYEESLYRSALSQVGGIRGSWMPPEGPAPRILVFEHENHAVAWAPFAAQAGAPVGVIVKTALQTEAMRALFKGLGIPEGRYKVVSMDVEIDRTSAEQTIREYFQRPGFPAAKLVTLPENTSAKEIEQILLGYGLRFDTSPMPRLIFVERHLGAEA